jgi:hypothetical protein
VKEITNIKVFLDYVFELNIPDVWDAKMCSFPYHVLGSGKNIPKWEDPFAPPCFASKNSSAPAVQVNLSQIVHNEIARL